MELSQTRAFLLQQPLIAVLRGLTPAEALPTAKALVKGGIRVIEITLDSPDALESVKRLSRATGELRSEGVAPTAAQVLLGAGTVLTAEAVEAVKVQGGSFIATPNVNPAVLQAAQTAGLFSISGSFTASEAFTALNAGAGALKLFPACVLGPEGVASLKAVLPKNTPLFAMGGVAATHFKAYLAAGASGFGVGGNVYRPRQAPAVTEEKSRQLVERFKACFS